MAGESRCNNEDGGGFTDTLRKVHLVRGKLVGVAGDAAMVTEVRRTLWEEPNPVLVTRWPKGEYSALCLAGNGKLFEVEDGQIIPHDQIPLMAIGVGGDVALGAAHAWLKLKRKRNLDRLKVSEARAMMKVALECATLLNSQCGGRVILKICDLREL